MAKRIFIAFNNQANAQALNEKILDVLQRFDRASGSRWSRIYHNSVFGKYAIELPHAETRPGYLHKIKDFIQNHHPEVFDFLSSRAVVEEIQTNADGERITDWIPID